VVLHCFLSVGTACEFWLFVFFSFFILYVILFELLHGKANGHDSNHLNLTVFILHCNL
jgi:cbb3-type cytochrome oxidase subunit 3